MTNGWYIEINGREITNPIARAAILAAAHLAVALLTIALALLPPLRTVFKTR